MATPNSDTAVYVNPFDRFDPPSVTEAASSAGVNPFDQFDSPTFGTTPGGAAIANPRGRVAPVTGESIVADITGAGALGLGAGLVAPRVLQGLGTAATGSGMPFGRALGTGLTYMGAAAGAAGPAARGAAGTLAGLASETAGKFAETAGAGPVTAEATRFVAGGITPDIAREVTKFTARVLSAWTMPGAISSTAIRELAGKLSKGISGIVGKDFSEVEEAQLVAALHGSQTPGEALDKIGAALKLGAQDILQKGETRATGVTRDAAYTNQLNIQRETDIATSRGADAAAKAKALYTASKSAVNDAETAARAELSAVSQGKAPYDQASTYVAALKNNILDAARQTRLAIGNERKLVDIGTDLRNASTGVEKKFRSDASQAFNETEAIVDAGVAKLESSGLRVASLPEYKALIRDLQSQIKLSVRAPDVAAGYKKLLDQVTVKVDEGAPAMSPMYQAIDDARRLMGESFSKDRVTGYEAIQKFAREDLYRKLRALQVSFGGKDVDTLLTNYADSRPDLVVFGSKAGQKMVGMDRGAITQYANQPENLPGQFFKTPTSFQQLVELTGDKALATQAALDYAQNQLAGKETSAQVRSWMKTNAQFLDAVPAVKKAVSTHEMALSAAERTGMSLDLSLQRANTRAGELRAGGTTQMNELAVQAGEVTKAGQADVNKLLSQATTEAERVTQAAATKAGGITTEAAAAANKLWDSATTSGRLNARELILKGDARQWELAGPILLRSSTGKRDMYDAVGQVLADRVSDGAVKGSTQWFNETVAPSIIKSGLLSANSAAGFAKQLAVIEAKRGASATELGFWRRALLQAIAGESSSVGSRGANAGFSLVSDIPNQNQNRLAAP